MVRKLKASKFGAEGRLSKVVDYYGGCFPQSGADDVSQKLMQRNDCVAWAKPPQSYLLDGSRTVCSIFIIK